MPVLIRSVSVALCLAFLSCGGTNKAPTAAESSSADAARSDAHAGARKIADEFGLGSMSLAMSTASVEAQWAAFAGKVGFEAALRSALTSFTSDSSDDESPLAMLRERDEGDSVDGNHAGLLEVMNRRDTRLRLVLADDGSVSPTRGEPLQDNWVFSLTIASLSDHVHWAIVDRSGERSTYNYGFN